MSIRAALLNLAVVTLSFPLSLFATDQFDSAAVWPLCGHITQSPPNGWVPTSGCPELRWGNADFTDFPLSSTFGPRQKASESYRYDFHRGIDIPTPENTPVFAITSGNVRIAGSHSSYSDPLVQIRHKRPNVNSCNSGGGCYSSNYMHLSSWVVSAGQNVTKGQLIGYSGASVSGFAHLHFEIRNAPGTHDPYSAWQRDAIHPLQVLPYNDTQADNISVNIDQVDQSNPLNPIVTATATIPNSIQLDLNNLSVTLYEKHINGSLALIPQPGQNGIGATPEGTGYNVNPPWFDMTLFNRQYSYKNSRNYPWSMFLLGGDHQSPYWDVMPANYNANIHLDQTSQNNQSIGAFNGLNIAPSQFNAASQNYQLTVTFNALIGVADPTKLCVHVTAIDVEGNSAAPAEYNCNP